MRRISVATKAFSKAKSHVAAALVVEETVRYLLRDVLVNILKPITRVRIRGSYTVGRWKVTLDHGSDDTFVFQEIFVERLYQAPPAVMNALPSRSLRILDLGGNIGLFGLWSMVTWPDATLTAFEPDPVNAARYRDFLRANESRWTLVEAFADNKGGTVQFSALGKASSSRLTAESGLEVDAVDVFPLMRQADLVKIDIEGGEWNILGDSRLASIDASVIVLEYHPDQCPSCDPKAESEALLTSAGYRVQGFFEEPSGVGMCWAYRSSTHRPASR